MTAGVGGPARWPWVLYLAVGAVLVVLYYLAPVTAGGFPLRVVLYCLISTSAAVAVFTGLARHRPRPALPWLLIAASQLVYALADAIFYISHYVFDVTAYPSLADPFYLAHYPLAVAGIVLLIRRRTPGRGLAGLLDAGTLAVVAAMLSWLYVLGPQTRLGAPLLVEVVSLGYPVMDLALLTVALGLVLGPGSRPPAFFLFIGWLAAIMTADTIYVVQQLNGTFQAGNFLDAIWLAGNLALGASALHPTMRAIAEPSPVPDAPLSPVRIAGLSAAALIAPAVLFAQWAGGSVRDVPVVAGTCALLFALTIARLAALVSDQRRLAITDALTGLHTRRFFEAQLPLEIAKARRSGGSVAVLIADVDHFKTINDRDGHPAGDQVLVEISARLRATVRAGEVLARYGGEEFALILPGATADTLPIIAERLRRTVAGEAITLPTGRRVMVTVSVGTSVHPTHGTTPDDLVSIADRALYAAKDAGRDQVVFGASPVYSEVPVDGLDYLHLVADEVDALLAGEQRSRAVARVARVLAAACGLDGESTRITELAGRLHDIGKIAIPRAVLVKPGPLTAPERELVRAHPEHGYRMVSVVPGHAAVAAVVRQHAEHWDGTGYPDGLRGDEIRPEARVVAVCTAWVAMLTDRPYQAALTVDLACAELVAGSGSQFEPALVEVFLALRERGDDTLGTHLLGKS
ncbi:diguanylate cyclase [Actinokineospora diospyrosa]|uniref:Diguanylate cyclase (GGDEF) domain-containing protein n=1 Tax=Actinokineospora diospyrosa TaxID=103728 RepID=A0ABT1I9G2_9PSEU|nr:diguanylate cyclase [Actinokineospora diospyrosa]MCP2269041.1 diguanylate cyclase (GGDEF) domain-containing protein [Actinokineospora diospyrosa]